MKRKSGWLIISLALFLGLMGCTKEKESVKDDNTKSSAVEDNNTGESNTDDEDSNNQDSLDIPEFSGDLDFTYVKETDAQSNLRSYPREAYIEEGMYQLQIMSQYRLLTFYDNATRQEVVVCSKSNCGHSAEGCDAYFDNESYPIPNLCYYNGYLYMPVLDEGYWYMEEISLDGSTRNKSCKLYKLFEETAIEADGSESVTMRCPPMCVHRGYVYFPDYYPGTQKSSLYRAELGSDEGAEIIYSLEGNNPGLFGVQPYGRYVLFQMGEFSSDYIDYEGSTYAYDTETGEISRIGENVINAYTVANNCLYYADLERDLYCKNLETGETELFFELEKDTSDLDICVFGREEGLVYQFTDWNNDGKIEQILLDYAGEEEPKYIEKQEEILPPY